jgi:flagellar motility protein MotE (MotC chaperone)
MPLVTEGEIMFMNELALFKYGKSIDQMFEEIKEINAKEEQLLAQKRTETEQLLAQQKAKEEHTIINMYQKLAIDVATIANILNVSTDFVQNVLSKNDLG